MKYFAFGIGFLSKGGSHMSEVIPIGEAGILTWLLLVFGAAGKQRGQIYGILSETPSHGPQTLAVARSHM